MNDFLRSDGKRNVYEFTCPVCDVTVEIGIPKRSTTVVHNECGMLLVQRPAKGMFGKPVLVLINLPDKLLGGSRY